MLFCAAIEHIVNQYGYADQYADDQVAKKATTGNFLQISWLQLLNVEIGEICFHDL